MKLIIYGKNIEVTERIKGQLEDKLKKLDKYIDPDTKVDVTLSVRKNEQKVEITFPMKGHIIRAEETSEDLYAAIDMAQETIIQQLVRYKNKLIDRKKSRREIFADDFMDEYEDYYDDEIEIVRMKKFTVEPMDPEEACEQMDMLGHNFFVFLNSETNRVNVVYKRYENTYGLIEPELA